MPKKKNMTSERICCLNKARVCYDIIRFMQNKRKTYESETSEICRIDDTWNELELKFDIKNFIVPDMPYMVKEKTDKNKYRFKFVLRSPHDNLDCLIISNKDLKIGDKILLLAISNWIPSPDVKDNYFWDYFYESFSKEELKEKLEKLN